MAEIAFSVGLMFSGDRDSGSWIVLTSKGIASENNITWEFNEYSTKKILN